MLALVKGSLEDLGQRLLNGVRGHHGVEQRTQRGRRDTSEGVFEITTKGVTIGLRPSTKRTDILWEA